MNVLRLKPLCGSLALTLLLAPFARADVKLLALFSDNMILQRGLSVPFWGTADAGEEVTVSARGQQGKATADAAGKWMVRLTPLEVGDAFDVTVAGKNTITLKNVLVGDVWLASGQSNMEWAVSNVTNVQQEIAEANYPALRMFTVKKGVADEPQTEASGQWQEANPANVARFSAVGYFFARELHKTLGVPIGVIHTSWGGTPAQAWTSRTALAADPDLQKILDQREQHLANYPKAKEDFDKKMVEWQAQADKAKAEGKPEPRRPGAPMGSTNPNIPTGLYNAMIAPLVPYAIKGAIWYQGESNAGAAAQYQKLFPAMIQGWRRDWGQGDFPFLFVQLANFQKRQTQPSEGGWAEIREAQTKTLYVPNTGMAVITDVGEEWDIHPRNKQEVGRRLALAALGQFYGKDVPYSGPMYDSMTIDGDKVRLRFKHTHGGLIAKNVGSPDAVLPAEHAAYATLNKLAQAKVIEAPQGGFKAPLTRYDVAVATARAQRTRPRPAGADAGTDVPTPEQVNELLASLQREFADELRGMGFPHETKPTALPNNAPLIGCAIAGQDGKWDWADAKIEGDTVVVSSLNVPNPVAVRYSWGSNPRGNLYNGAGLPASPFRTDEPTAAGATTPAVTTAPAATTSTNSATSILRPRNNSLASAATGLIIEDIRVGTGAQAKAGDNVTVHYRGTLTNGKQFDASYDRGQPFQFPLGAGRVIKGWDQGVAGMKEGGKRKLTIPASLGYGAQGIGPIPPNATLLFEVELLKVN